MSAGDWSQFSPNWQQPAPTIDTLSRIPAPVSRDGMAEILLSGALGRRDSLPVVVRPVAGFVDAAEDELDGLADLDVVGLDLDQLEVDSRALDLGDRDDRRWVRRREEVVEGVGHDPAGLVRESHLVELILAEAGLADPLRGELDRFAEATSLSEEAQVVVPLPEEDGRGEARIRASLPLRRGESPRLDVVVVSSDHASTTEMPGHASSGGELLDRGGRPEGR